MGFIYANAGLVIGCLSEECRGAMEFMRRGEQMDDAALISLEAEPWVESVWTYQEVVNSQELLMACHGDEYPMNSPASQDGALLDKKHLRNVTDGPHFLNMVGWSLEGYRSLRSLTTIESRQKLPRLGAFEELIGDYMVANYTQRSALQVMSNLDRRDQTEPKNTLLSMMGAVSQDIFRRSIDDSIEHIADAFIEMCEKKNDYSFIFSTNARPPGSCRPVSQVLHSVLPWHNWGQGQPGKIRDGSLQLKDMVLLDVGGAVCEQAREFIDDWLNGPQMPGDERRPGICDDELINGAFNNLKGMDYTGSSKAFVCAEGLFFPQQFIPGDKELLVAVLVCTSISWPFGNPGMVETSVDPRYIPGVFVGTTQGRPKRSVDVNYSL
ncbi:MAG: hypothetical protein Q9162_002497 [Coniocarpon cinnabarinum]